MSQGFHPILGQILCRTGAGYRGMLSKR
jgi:hypothetical protein